jgi:hypothetical protein
VLLQKEDRRDSSIYANDGVVPPGVVRLTCLPCAEALGLIVSSSGLGRCFILRNVFHPHGLDRIFAAGLHVDQSEGGTLAFVCGLDGHDMLIFLGAYFQFHFVACVIALALELVRIF